MILETIGTTLLGEWIRSKWPKKPTQNNISAIRTISREMPTAETVGELRELLSNFADEVPLVGGGQNFVHLQVRELDGVGQITMGSSSHPKRSETTRRYHEEHPTPDYKFYGLKTTYRMVDGFVVQVPKGKNVDDVPYYTEVNR